MRGIKKQSHCNSIEISPYEELRRFQGVSKFHHCEQNFESDMLAQVDATFLKHPR